MSSVFAHCASYAHTKSRAWLVIVCIATLAALLTNSSLAAFGATSADAVDATEIVRKAILNYKAREMNAREYKYVEFDYAFEKLFHGELEDSEVYDVIPLGANLFRRHVAHDGRPLPPQEEMSEQQRLDRAIRDEEESFEKRVENPEAKPPEDPAPYGTPKWELMYSQQFGSWQLDLYALPGGFSFRLLGEEVSEGRKLLVVEGKPSGNVTWSRRGTLPLNNFDIKLWIDQDELEVVKFEARAKKKGVLARPEHAIVNRQEFPGTSGDKELDSLYESNLWYGPGTVITRVWKKVNDEAWLPAVLEVKGKVSLERDYPNGDHGTATWPMTQRTTYYDYEKFRVNHRILPSLPEEK